MLGRKVPSINECTQPQMRITHKNFIAWRLALHYFADRWQTMVWLEYKYAGKGKEHMKKMISSISAIVGVILLIIGIIANKNVGRTISKSVVIKGANGPTSVFIAGKVRKSTVFLSIATGVIFLITAIIMFASKKELK